MTDSPVFTVDHVYVIGAGGVGSWLLPVLLRLFNNQPHPPEVTVIDGDVLEEKNLDRQLFVSDDIGSGKAVALCDRYESYYKGVLYARAQYFTVGMDGIADNSLFLVCVDNHAARKAVLETIDRQGGRAIIGANEYTDSEAYMYEQSFQGGPLDPRTYYPVIMTDDRDDPTRPASCTGHASEVTPQLVLANFSAANFMLWLVWFHYIERPAMDRATTFNYWPHFHSNTFSRFNTHLVGGTLAPPTTATPK